MANALSSLRALIEAQMAATWTGVDDFFRVFDAERLNWRQAIQKYQEGDSAGIHAPWSTIQAMPVAPAEFGISNDALMVPFRLWYIVGLRGDDGTAKDSLTAHTELEQALRDLSLALFRGETWTCIDRRQDLSSDNEANRYFFSMNAPFMAGYVEATFVVGDTYAA